jgi:hypothetical protein
MRWFFVRLYGREQRETNEIYMLNLRVKQALFQLSYDPAGSMISSFWSVPGVLSMLRFRGTLYRGGMDSRHGVG